MSAKTPITSKSKTKTLNSRQLDIQRSRQSNGTSKSEWNLMFYIVGDEYLSGSMISQLKELTDAGFQKNTNVLAFFDPNCNGKNARIFDVNHQRKKQFRKRTVIGDGKDPYVRDIAEDCHIPCLPQLPAALSLRYFLEYSRFYYPAKNYMLFLMGHGVIVGNDSFLPDPDDASSITLTDLGWILRNFGEEVRGDKANFRLIGFHSCSMNSVELAHELSGSADYMMGTQGTAFPGSWPYRQLLKKIFLTIQRSKGRNGKSIKLVPTILESLQDLSFYNSEDFWLAGYSSDLSICRLDKINDLKPALSQLSQALKDGLDNPQIKNCIQLAHLKSQSYWVENYSDLYDFCACLIEECKSDSKLRNACERVKEVLQEGKNNLIMYSDYYGPSYQHSHGLSIYFPWKPPHASISQNYADYSFTKDYNSHSWWSFLQKYFIETRRKPPQPTKEDEAIRRPSLPTPPPRSAEWLKRISPEEILRMAGSLAPPDKVGPPLGKPSIPSPGLVGPDKVGPPLGPPDKVGPPLGQPSYVGTALVGPDKVGPPLGPDKVGIGLSGSVIIKNFYDPDNIFITSRVQPFHRNNNGAKGKTKNNPPRRNR